MASPWLHLVGLHTHLGSQIFSPQPYRQAIGILYKVACDEGFIPEEFSPGGGWGVRYIERDPSDDAAPWIQAISQEVEQQCGRLGWPLPRLVVEPGRWLVARAGVALYSVGAQKESANGNHIVALDGGMADNPRVALYQARYTARVVQAPAAPPVNKVRLVGKFCESGDVLINEVSLPEMHRGDLIAMPAAGAYQLSMSSNYNFATRPPVLWLEEGQVEVLQRRESPSDPCWWTNC
jgi:diaminopimelate decarboxylase